MTLIRNMTGLTILFLCLAWRGEAAWPSGGRSPSSIPSKPSVAAKTWSRTPLFVRCRGNSPRCLDVRRLREAMTRSSAADLSALAALVDRIDGRERGATRRIVAIRRAFAQEEASIFEQALYEELRARVELLRRRRVLRSTRRAGRGDPRCDEVFRRDLQAWTHLDEELGATLHELVRTRVPNPRAEGAVPSPSE